MIRVDYNSYLNSQTEWARSLIREARRLQGSHAIELQNRAAKALSRTVQVERVLVLR